MIHIVIVHDIIHNNDTDAMIIIISILLLLFLLLIIIIAEGPPLLAPQTLDVPVAVTDARKLPEVLKVISKLNMYLDPPHKPSTHHYIEWSIFGQHSKTSAALNSSKSSYDTASKSS